MNANNFTAVNASREPVNMPKRDFYRLPVTLRGLIQGRLMVLAKDQGGQAFIPVNLI